MRAEGTSHSASWACRAPSLMDIISLSRHTAHSLFISNHYTTIAPQPYALATNPTNQKVCVAVSVCGFFFVCVSIWERQIGLEDVLPNKHKTIHQTIQLKSWNEIFFKCCLLWKGGHMNPDSITLCFLCCQDCQDNSFCFCRCVF